MCKVDLFVLRVFEVVVVVVVVVALGQTINDSELKVSSNLIIAIGTNCGIVT